VDGTTAATCAGVHSGTHLGEDTRCNEVDCDIPGDLDGDTDVDVRDIGLVFLCFGLPATPGTVCERADVNNDGTVNLEDVRAVIQNLDGPR